MGLRGPAPKPTKLKIAAGNPGKRRLNDREATPPVEAPKMPGWLSERAQAEWKRIVPDLLAQGLLARIDLAALCAYCQSVAELELATATLDREGRVCVWPIIDKAGEKVGERLKSHPAVAQQAAAMARLKSFLTEFGLSPASRSRVQAGDAPRTGADARESKFFGG